MSNTSKVQSAPEDSNTDPITSATGIPVDRQTAGPDGDLIQEVLDASMAEDRSATQLVPQNLPGSEVNKENDMQGVSGLDFENVPPSAVMHADVNQIGLHHAANRLENNQPASPKDFMRRVMYQIPLNKLYKIVASCQFNDSSNFCPILVKIEDEKILQFNNGYKYLLQVWTKNGEMVYERSLRQPCSNWNISGDKFLFQEETNSEDVYVVKLYLSKRPFVFKFTLPTHVVENRVNTFFDVVSEQFRIPEESKNVGRIVTDQNDVDNSAFGDQSHIEEAEEADKLADIKEMHKRGEFKSMEISQFLKKSNAVTDVNALSLLKSAANINKKFQETIIERAPDKMIDHLQDHIILAFRDFVIYAEVGQYGVDDPSKIPANTNTQLANFIHITIPENQLKLFDLHKNYKIVAIQEMREEMSAIVLEDLHTRQLRFLRVFFEDIDGKDRLSVVQLGVLVSGSALAASPLLKFRSVAKVDPKTGKHYSVSIGLRESGLFEVYSDYMLVYDYLNPLMHAVDIETDFNQFYIKFCTNVDEISSASQFSDLKFQLRQVRHFWRNRISFNTSKVKRLAKWDTVLDRRVSEYVRLYTNILNFMTFMVVSHRNMVSIFDMTKGSSAEAKWIETHKFDQGNIRQMLLKKRSRSDRREAIDKRVSRGQLQEGDFSFKTALPVYKQYQLVLLMGTHIIVNASVSMSGKITQNSTYEAPGRIIHFKDDDRHRMGIILLTDSSVKSVDYQEYHQHKIFQFPYSRNEASEVQIYSFKMGGFHELINSKESDSVEFDSYFSILQANRSAFEREQNTFEEGADDQQAVDEIQHVFAEKEQIIVLLISSKVGQSQTIFPVFKEKDDKGDISGMHLIKNSENMKEIKFEEEVDDIPHHTFFITTDEFGEEYVDNFVQIGYNEVKIFDKGMSLRLSIKGMNIRSATDVHMSYIYMINDQIVRPFTITDEVEGITTEQPDFCYSSSGFYIMDLARMLSGKVEKYKMASSVGGFANYIDNSKFSDRFSIMQSFDKISVVPFPHLNLINCVGMELKSEYLIWREKNGFFTALDKRGVLNTWSMLDGKMLYTEPVNGEGSEKSMRNYVVYRSDKEDLTYTRNYQSGPKATINLLKSKLPADLNTPIINKSLLERKLEKQDKQNQHGTVSLDRNVRQLERGLLRCHDPDLDVKVLNSQQQSNLYHFKVMELKTHEDTGTGSHCKLKFHFMFDIILKKERNNLKMFEWDINSNPVQRLYLSKDTNKLMETINNTVATIYKRENIDNQGKSIAINNLIMFDKEDAADNGQQVKWKIDYRIKCFPKSLCTKTSVPYLFSPNFKYMLDFNYRQKMFVIKEMRTQHIYINIPRDLLNTDWGTMSGESAIKIITSRFMWLSDDSFRIIMEGNLDCIFKFEDLGEDKKGNDRKPVMKLISCAKVDNLFVNMNKRDSPHVILHPPTLESRDVLERLIRLNQRYKVELQHALNLKHDYNLLASINSIDYLQDWDAVHSSFDIQLSYTWLDWFIAEKVITDDLFQLERIDEEQQLQLCFNIMPKGRGILHLLAGGNLTQNDDMEGVEGGGDQISSFFATVDLFNVASKTHTDIEVIGVGEGEGVSFEIPILQDMYGFTPLDVAMGVEKVRLDDRRYFWHDDAAVEHMKFSENFAMANAIFENLSSYGFMHSSHQISEATIEAIKASLPAISGYLQSRIVKAEHQFSSQTQRSISSKVMRTSAAYGEYGSLRVPIMTRDKHIEEAMFDKEGSLRPMELNLIDLPHFYSHNYIGFDFITALTKSDDIEIFGLSTVQILIDAQLERWQRINAVAVGFPMVLQLLVFWYWSNVVLPNLSQDSFQNQETICNTILIITAFYLIAIEISSIYVRRFRYLTSITKIANIITPVLILFNVFNDDTTEVSFWTVQTWAALSIWFRFLLYLKTIPTFSWLIRMITACIYDMMSFMVVLIIGVVAFADAFSSIEQILMIREDLEPRVLPENASTYERYVQGYVVAWQKSYATSLGEFDGNLEFYQEGEWLVWFLCTIFNLVLLFNLLIAIISETFAEKLETAVQLGYREKVIQIKSLQDSIYGFWKAEYNPTELIFLAKNISSDEISKEDFADKLGDLDQKLDDVKDELKSFTEEKLSELFTSIVQKVVPQDKQADKKAKQAAQMKSKLAKMVRMKKAAAESDDDEQVTAAQKKRQVKETLSKKKKH